MDYYELKEQPFGVTPDPRFLYSTPSHREALSALVYGIEAGRGFMTLLAQPGMGKTTLLFRLLEQYRTAARRAFLFQTQCDSREFLAYLLADLGIEAGEQNLAEMQVRLNEFLAAETRAGRRLLLFVDEAQNLDDSVLETVRLISDFETPQRKLIQIVLAGHPSLAEKLAAPALRQRVSIRTRLKPLAPEEVEAYIGYRLHIGGYRDDCGPLFTPEAQYLLATRSEGIPRNINNLCFHSLLTGFALSRKTIDIEIVREVVADLDQSLPAAERQQSDVPTAAAHSFALPQLAAELPDKLPTLRPAQPSSQVLPPQRLQQRAEAHMSALLGNRPNDLPDDRATISGTAQNSKVNDSFEPLQPGADEQEDHKQQTEGILNLSANETSLAGQQETSATMEVFGEPASTKLRSIETEHLAELKNEFQSEASEELQRQIGNLEAAAEKTRMEFNAFADSTRSLLRDGEPGRRLTEAHEQIEKACERADAAVKHISGNVEAAVSKLQSVGQGLEAKLSQAVHDMRKIADDVVASSSTLLEKRFADLTEAFQQKFSASQTGLLRDTERKLADLARNSIESLSKELNGKMSAEARGILESFQQEAKSIAQHSPDQSSAPNRYTFEPLRSSELSHATIPAVPKVNVKRGLSSYEDDQLEVRSKLISASRATADNRTFDSAVSWLATITPIILFFLFSIFVLLSIRPVMRLRTSPPADYFEENPAWTSKHRLAQERLALAYWRSAVRDMQAKYAFGTQLPDEPPPEFNADVSVTNSEPAGGDPTSRHRYWERLREAWILPENWEKSYVWSTNWIMKPSRQ